MRDFVLSSGCERRRSVVILVWFVGSSRRRESRSRELRAHTVPGPGNPGAEVPRPVPFCAWD